jgi:hypothetical protein
MPLRTTLSSDGRSITEKVLAKDGTLTRIQTERRQGLVFMRAKKRVLYADNLSA